MGIERCLDDHVDDSRTNSTQEKIFIKAFCAPGVLQIGSEHSQVQQIEQNVENAVVQKYVRDWLPKSEPMGYRVGNQPEPIQPETPSRSRECKPGEFLKQKDADTYDAQRFDRARKVAADVKSVTIAAREVAHRASVSACRGRVKNCKKISAFFLKGAGSQHLAAVHIGVLAGCLEL